MLDYQQYAAAWMDFRASPGTDATYRVRIRSTRLGEGAFTGNTVELGPWSPTGTFLGLGSYLDINIGASARLHGHWAVNTSEGGVSTSRTQIWSPRSW